MKLIKNYHVDSAYTFLQGMDTKEIEDMIENYGSDHELIEGELKKKYHKKDYFVLVDYIDDDNGYFHIRIWEKKQKSKHFKA